MAASGSKVVIFAAMGGNLAIAVTKFAAASLTGSSSMMSEGIHSLVDTGNGLVLLWGIHQSTRPPDDLHPFGHGKELYFWTLVVALLIFALGGGISIYEGIVHIRHPAQQLDPSLNYIVLSLAFIFEAAPWWVALRQFRKVKGPLGYIEAIRASKDPTTFTVLFEDSAALLGLIIAFIGIFLGHQFGLSQLDGIASVLIGAILCVVAAFLAYESKGLLIGEAMDPRTRDSINRLVQADPDIDRLVRALSMHFGPDEVLLTMEIAFRPGLSASQVAAATDRLDKAIRQDHPEARHIFVEAQSLAATAALRAGPRLDGRESVATP